MAAVAAMRGHDLLFLGGPGIWDEELLLPWLKDLHLAHVFLIRPIIYYTSIYNLTRK